MKQFAEIKDLTGHNVSPSQFNVFVNCPQKWNLQYQYKEPQPDAMRMATGRTFHKIFEVTTKNYKKDDFLQAGDRIAYVSELALQFVPSHWKVLFQPILGFFAKFEVRRFDKLMGFCDDDQDEAWEYFIPAEVEVHHLDDSEGIHFIIDRLMKIPPGFAKNTEDAILVFDWKPTGYDYNTDLNRQLAFMALELNTPYVWSYFYRTNIELLPKVVAPQSFTALKKNATIMLNCIKNGKFEKKFGWNCHFCPYLYNCKLKNGDLFNLLDGRRNKVKFYGDAPVGEIDVVQQSE